MGTPARHVTQLLRPQTPCRENQDENHIAGPRGDSGEGNGICGEHRAGGDTLCTSVPLSQGASVADGRVGPAAAPPPTPTLWSLSPQPPSSQSGEKPTWVTQKSRREGDEAKPQWELRLQPSRQPQESLPVPVSPGHVRVRV